jgi:hypothetical protein
VQKVHILLRKKQWTPIVIHCFFVVKIYKALLHF